MRSFREAVRMIASLGGFLGRKDDGEPGVKTIWLGLRRLYHFSLFVADILLPSPFLGEGLGVRVINHLCHYFRKMVLHDISQTWKLSHQISPPIEPP
jgi:hypothetical protein